MEKKRPQLGTSKLQMEKLIGKGKHTVKVGNNLHTNISQPATVRRGEHKCRILEMHYKTSNLKQSCLYTDCYRYQIFMATSKPKIYNRYTHKIEKGIQAQH